LNGLDYTDDEIEKIINDIYGGSISREVLPVGLYNDIKARLNKAVFDGFGGTYSDFDTSTEAGLMMAGFEKNIAVFSGAKTFQQVNDMSNFLFTGTDKIPFGEFKKHATEIFETYNKNWLNTEYNTALSQASSARQWNDIKANEETFPLLKYITIGDERVRQQHKDLDEVVFAVGDKFWNDYFPPNDWNCRCTTEQLEEGEEPTTDPKRTFDPNPDLFKMNAGKDKIIFREDIHPYLKVDKRFEVALADNFGLPFKPEVKVVKPKPARKPKTPAVPAPAPNVFKPAGSIKEARSMFVDVIENNSKLKINGVTLSSDLSLDQVNVRLETVGDLFKEYNLSDAINTNKTTKLSFRSSRSAHGYVKTRLNITEGAELVEMNFGSTTDKGLQRIFSEDFIGTRFKSRVDLVNLEKATTTHEFAHVIALENHTMVYTSKGLDVFFNELNSLKRQYFNEMMDLNKAKNLKGINEISLGKYASTNTNEFMAEGFTEYKLSSQPSKYAVKIGELIDKTFKK
jgi:SPP1 gp7 family putative phage head morphogenesis protein